MKPEEHPYSRYGAAIALLKSGKSHVDELNIMEIQDILKNSLNYFRIEPKETKLNQISFDYIKSNEFISYPLLIKGNKKEGKFLAPNVISCDYKRGMKLPSTSLYSALSSLINEMGEDKVKKKSITQDLAPITTKTNYRGNASPGYIYEDIRISAYCAIATMHPSKPTITVELVPTAIIPDLEIDDLKKFIRLFEVMLHNNTTGLLKAKRREDAEKIPRPKIFNGNFPYAPRSHAFGAAGLLGAIGQWAKEAGYIDEALPVLDSLVNQPLYIINYDKTEVVSFDHYVVELAKEFKLSNIINALEFSTLLSDEKRFVNGRPNPKYELFWMMSNRFLQLFNRPAFQNFLSHRAEYQTDVQHLLNQYFMGKENIKPEIVHSAFKLGQWLNRKASFSASERFRERHDKRMPLNDHTPQADKEWKEWRKYKSHFLLEIESSTLASKTPEELLFSVLRRVGQLTDDEAPKEAQQFMKALNEGGENGLSLKQAQHLLLAYSRLKSGKVEEESEFDQEDENKQFNIN